MKIRLQIVPFPWQFLLSKEIIYRLALYLLITELCLLKKQKSNFFSLYSELKIGFWGETYYLQDEGSLAEMRSYLKKENIEINTKIVPTSMLRIKSLAPEKESKPKLSRNLTIITHASYWDLIACLLSIFSKKIEIILSKES